MSVSAVREFEEALAEKGVKPQELMRRAGAVVALQAARLYLCTATRTVLENGLALFKVTAPESM